EPRTAAETPATERGRSTASGRCRLTFDQSQACFSSTSGSVDTISPKSLSAEFRGSEDIVREVLERGVYLSCRRTNGRGWHKLSRRVFIMQQIGDMEKRR